MVQESMPRNMNFLTKYSRLLNDSEVLVLAICIHMTIQNSFSPFAFREDQMPCSEWSDGLSHK